MVHPLQRFVEEAEVAQQRGGGIDVERRADLGRDIGKGHILGVQGAVFVKKMIHAAL